MPFLHLMRQVIINFKSVARCRDMTEQQKVKKQGRDDHIKQSST